MRSQLLLETLLISVVIITFIVAIFNNDYFVVQFSAPSKI